MGNLDIEKIGKREFGSNQNIVGFQRGRINQIAGRLKGGQWKKHFERFKKAMKR